MADQAEVDVTHDVGQFTQAVEAFRARVPVTDDEWKRMNAKAKEKGWKIANVMSANVIQHVFNALDAAISQGQSFEDFKPNVKDMLEQSWGGQRPGLIETTFRNAAMTSYNQGRHAIQSAPAIKRRRPFLRFSRIGDSRVSKICRPCEGVILPQDHPWWNTHYPQLHHNCRHRVDALTEEEAIAEGITANPPSVQAQEGFGLRPSTQGNDWSPDLLGFPRELRQAVSERI